ncbi:hypothetical protein DdX_15390 [Ditylenchus destructor]|uniref:Uncharacterized protein n=1 Tax=Ditylenchus destructor TaxID=166010 RepID=A0AAD4R0V7_9BILA|nr:hypothetical protein DdX_15390 [Ditylenchus destructor]
MQRADAWVCPCILPLKRLLSSNSKFESVKDRPSDFVIGNHLERHSQGFRCSVTSGSGFPGDMTANLVYGLDLTPSENDPLSLDDEDVEHADRGPIAMPYQNWGTPSQYTAWSFGDIPSRG